jgi:signal transduction histidine kinase
LTGRLVPVESVEPIDRGPDAGDLAEGASERREDILEAIAYAAGRFLRGGSLDDALADVLARLGQASGASRVVLTERVTRGSRSYMRPRAEWDGHGVRPLILPAGPDGYPYFQRWETELAAGRLVAGRISDFPADEQIPLAADSVGSIVVMPIAAGDTWWGHVGYDDKSRDRIWSGPEIEALRAAAGIIGAAIRQAAAADAIERRNAIIGSVAAAIPLLVATERWIAVLPELLRSLQAVMAARSAWAYRLQPDATARLVAEVVAPGEQTATPFGQVARLDPRILVALGEGRAIQNTTFTDTPDDELAAFAALGMRSWVVVPIVANGKLWGGVGIDSRDERSWDDGEIVALQVAAAAISATIEREATAERVRQLEKMDAVGRLAGGLAHDFGNLLAIVLGHAELIRDDSVDPTRGDAETILDAAVRGRDLVRDLLTFSGSRGGDIRATDVGALLGRIIRILRAAVGSGIEIVLRLEPGTPPILVDPDELEHVLVNLVVNARDAMPSGGRITISSAVAPATETPDGRVAEQVVLSVADTGTGIDESTRARIFEPFFSTKPEGVGTGLGLATAYGSVAAWGGSIEVDSELGSGTTFRLLLRAAPPA